jgi:hypothetical protein
MLSMWSSSDLYDTHPEFYPIFLLTFGVQKNQRLYLLYNVLDDIENQRFRDFTPDKEMRNEGDKTEIYPYKN